MTAAPTVVAYFGDDPLRGYQIAQWLPVLELLDEVEPVVVVLRDEATTATIEPRTPLRVVLAAPFAELRAAYAEIDPKVVLYCNNSPTNVESLLDPRALHVHVNHGESDKQSSASNLAKAYDQVFVAGQAAVDRYAAGLLDFDTSRLVRVGRPQLDRAPPSLLEPSSRRTVLYAPTFEGEADYNNYSSLDRFGPEIVTQLLSVPDSRIVYKPHPRILGSRDHGIREAHREVVRLVTDAGQLALEDADILAVIPDCDAMVTDVSSVGLDWLYLRTDRPLFMTDRHADAERLHVTAPVSRCADVVDSSTVSALGTLVAERFEHDGLLEKRTAMRHHYFDDIAVGESTTRFIEAVRAAVRRRDSLLATQISQHPLAGQPPG